ncbi:MAG: VOC family protein [bacterium]
MTAFQKIAPHLWYDKEAKAAAEFYVSAFGKDSKIINVTTIHDTPSGSADIVVFSLLGQSFQSIGAGPIFTFNPSISLQVHCPTKDEVDALWKKLSQGGKVLMELGAYPFSERYGWCEDQYGLSWQIMYEKDSGAKTTITPMLLFVGSNCGKAEEAITFWTSMFPNSKKNIAMYYDKGEQPDKEGTVKYASFSLEGKEFAVMDSAHDHNFTFNEAISFMIMCDTQEEIDYYWEKLSAVPEAEQCGWLKDKFGVSWQVVPTAMETIMSGNDPERAARVTKAFLAMKKFDIAALERAAEGK